ncbi:hypothetical protein OU683_05755, partial [Salinimicrobium sp. TH3]|nr:hypothetical protein [Salinimicrobium sp. TH3]
MIWKTTLTLLVAIFSLGSSYGQFSSTQPDLRTTFTGNCTANSYTIEEVFLSDASGNPISSTLKSCTIGETRQVYVSVKYKSNANADNYSARIFADLLIDGEKFTSINYYKGFLPSATNTPRVFTITNFSYNWSCGEELQLTNFLVAWTTSENKKKDLSITYNDADYIKSQCQFPPNIFVSAPLAVQFDYSGCTEDGVATVNYTSTTNGGRAPFIYKWDFDSNGTVDATTKNATFQFSGNFTTTKLIVTDSLNTSNSYSLTINKPTEVIASISGNSDLTCNVTSVELDASGSNLAGTPSYSWNTGSTSSSITVTEAGEYTVTVTDEKGCFDTESIIVSAISDTTAPTPDATSLPDITAQCEVNSLTAPTATDNCGETVSVSHNTTLPITATGTTVVIWTFEDAAGNVATQTQNVVIEDTTAPTPDAASLTDVTAQCEVTSLTAPTATDNCSAVTVSNNASLPINTQGTTVVTWTFEDAQGNTSTQNQNVIITDDIAPVADATSLPDVTAQCEVTSLTAPTATDNCSAVTVSHNASLPISAQGTTVVTWTFEDAQGNTSTQNQNVIITDDTAPVADETSLPDVTAQCEVTSLTAPTATDNCSAVTVSHNASLPISAQGTTVVTWTFEDAQGNTSTQNQNVIITDDTAPVADATSLADVTAQCEVTSLTAPTATDNCSAVTVSHNASLPISAQGTTVVTWTFEDALGNTSTQNQNVIITDDTAPVADATSLPDVTAQCEVTSLTAPTATDNCSAVTVSNNASLPINAQGTTVVTWTFEDAQGNTSSQNQNIIITDDTAPVADATSLADVTAQCEVT